MTKIAVTGGSGKAGRAVVRRPARARAIEVLQHRQGAVGGVERRRTRRRRSCYADLTDYGETLEALGNAETLPGIEAVVHLAAIPSPVHATPDLTFRTNITSTHTVFAAAARLGLKRIVWASSETTLGLPFDTPPDYAPVDEEHELRPESSYALSKVLGEEMARQFHRWSGIPIVGLRFSNVMERARLRALPRLLGRPAAAQVEPVGLRRREPRRAERAPRARGRRAPAPTRSSSPRATR